MGNKHIIYGLRNPKTDEYRYIGKSSVGIKRAYSHFVRSHNRKVNVWVHELDQLDVVPIVDILEYCDEETLDEKETWWINYFSGVGCHLFNIMKKEQTGDMFNINNDCTAIGSAVKKKRKGYGMTTMSVSSSVGLDRTTLYQIEKGNPKVSMSSYKKVCEFLGMLIITVDKESTNKTFIWLDDTRNPYSNINKYDSLCGVKEGDIRWVRTYDEFVKWIKNNGVPSVISFDYDLGEDITKSRVRQGVNKKEARRLKKDEKNGLDCAQWIISYCALNEFKIPVCHVHSMNPNGKIKIEKILNNALAKQGG